MTLPETEYISILGAPDAGAEGVALKPVSKPLPEELPILGLADVVVFPGMIVPLLVESPGSTRLIDDVVTGDRFVGLVLQKKAELQDPAPEDLHTVGCASRIVKMLKFPDGTVRVLIEGLRRIRLKEFSTSKPYPRAKVEVLKDAAEETMEVLALARNARERFNVVIEQTPAMAEQVKIAALNTEQPGQLADLIAANLNLSIEDRQKLLETNNVQDRLNVLLPLLAREQELLSLGTKIQKEVTSSLTRGQRDAFLREQVRAIQRELGEEDPSAAEVAGLREKVEKNDLSEEAKKVALRELDRMQSIPPASAEYTVSRSYVDWLVNLPWSKSTADKLDLAEAQRVLDSHHHGLKKVKERLIEYLAVLKLNQKIKGPILCLVGPPGVGKTSLGRSVAEALGRKFVRIALGGMRDEAEIRGHRRTYVGALPGRILQGLRRAESNNPVVLLDELDKIGNDFRGDPAAALLEVLDPQQNGTFVDNYLEIPFDLSRVLFLTTANWLEPVHAALRDRLEIIELPSYTPTEKLHIARNYLLPRQLAEHGLKPKLLKLPDATMKQLIHGYTRETGVRQLEREIATVSRKAAREIATVHGLPQPITATPDKLLQYLGPAKYLDENAERIDEPGIAIGLAWTPVGGDILFIEATRMPGTGRLILTGSLGEVMKESAQAALSYLRSQADALHIPESEFSKTDIHLHVPAGATPKDGPSAGVTITVAMASLFTRRRVKNNLAMTGEISLRGRVLRVGGIKEKVMAAARAGVREILLPFHNKTDLDEVPEEIRKRLKIHGIQRIDEGIKLALEPAAKPVKIAKVGKKS